MLKGVQIGIFEGSSQILHGVVRILSFHGSKFGFHVSTGIEAVRRIDAFGGAVFDVVGPCIHTGIVDQTLHTISIGLQLSKHSFFGNASASLRGVELQGFSFVVVLSIKELVGAYVFSVTIFLEVLIIAISASETSFVEGFFHLGLVPGAVELLKLSKFVDFVSGVIEPFRCSHFTHSSGVRCSFFSALN